MSETRIPGPEERIALLRKLGFVQPEQPTVVINVSGDLVLNLAAPEADQTAAAAPRRGKATTT